MTPSKTKKAEEVVSPDEHDAELPEIVDEAVIEPAVVGIPASAPGGPVPGRKSLGVKEPIIFKWKIIGHSAGMNLTLFKSVEREEVEAQLERLTRDGYYTNLQILEASAKVEQPPQPKEAKKAAKVREAPAKPPEKPARKSTPLRIPGKAPVSKKSAPSKSAAKSSSKSSKPKPQSQSQSKPSSKRTAKKK